MLVTAVTVAIGAISLPATGAAAAEPPRDPAELILASELPDGAIAQWIDRNRIDPYLGNYADMGLARAYTATGNARYIRAAWRWLAWYRDHMDADGYVTDYTVGPGPGFAETSTGDMDSTDGYAGTFLVALREVFAASGDTARLRSFASAAGLAVHAILSTQQPDGLTWASPRYHAALLMDQAEAYAGLRAAASLAQAMDAPSLSSKAGPAANAIRQAVAGLWRADGPAFAVARFEDGAVDEASWGRYYPDATSQAWAVAVGNGLSPTHPLIPAARARQLLGRFASRWPQWDRPSAQVAFDGGSHAVEFWPMVGAAFSAVGRTSSGTRGTAAIVSWARDRAWQWPFSVGAAGEALLISAG